MSLLSCKQLAFSYDGVPVVEGIDFCLESGSYLCIVGENGSGKTTLVKGLLGLLRPVHGSITFGEGLEATRSTPHGARPAPHNERPARPATRIGYLPQQAPAQRNFPASVNEVVLSGRLGGKGLSPFYTRADKQAARDALEQLGVAALAKHAYGELSGGQQQRVLLARALAAADDGLQLLVLDEPMSALDPHVKQELYELIAALNKEQGITVVMVTHDVQSATSQASHILLLNKTQEFFGSAHDFMHTSIGQELMRDSCGGHCAICGLNLESEGGHRH